MDFEKIETQEQLDSIIETRLQDITNNHQKACSEYDKKIDDMTKEAQSNAQKISDYEKQIADLKNKVSEFETQSLKQKIASETGLPAQLADRLSGNSEEELKQDAEKLSKIFKRTAPMKSSESTGADTKNTAMKNFIAQLIK